MSVENTLSIHTYLHCGQCLDELNNNPDVRGKYSPRDYVQIEVGFTKKGLQVWCKRHECNIVHIDFEKHQHPANVTCKRGEPS